MVIIFVISGYITALLLGLTEESDSKQVDRIVELKTSEKYSGQNMEQFEKKLDVGAMYTMDIFVINVKAKGGKADLKFEVSFEMGNKDLNPELDQKTPQIRDLIITMVSSKSIEEISTSVGQDKLKNQMKQRINRILKEDKIRNIYFSTFVAK